MPSSARVRQVFTIVSSLGLFACSADGGTGEGGSDCAGGKCDEADEDVPEAACDGQIEDKSGQGLEGKIAGRLGDPIAKIALTDGDSCPTTFAAVVDKLKASDACSFHRSMLVSETAQLMGEPHVYRSVTAFDCEVEGERAIALFSQFGIDARGGTDNVQLPTNAEMIGFDPVEGIFNYYETDTNKVDFFGDSRQYVTDGPGTGSGQGQDRRCANCHTGGGLIMKELDAPWVHWEGDFFTPGHSEIISNNEDLLGEQSDGIEMEDIVREFNRQWEPTRLAHTKAEGTLQDLLRPVFCTVEVNIESEPEEALEEGELFLGGIATDNGFDNFLESFGAVVPLHFFAYEILRERFGQRVAVPGEHVDTVSVLPRVVRSTFDRQFQERLVEDGIISEEFVRDVRAIDFTRPIFSDDRCGLLQFAPELSGDARTAQQVRDGFIANLQAEDPSEGTPAADLLRYLQDEQDDQDAARDVFATACDARDDSTSVDTDFGPEEVFDVGEDALIYISHVRGQAEELALFEFDGQTMPHDNLPTRPGLRFHPQTCELVTEYVSVELPAQAPEDGGDGDSETTGGDVDPGATCEGRCGEFTNGASCQCDDMCGQFGNCCDDIDTVCG